MKKFLFLFVVGFSISFSIYTQTWVEFIASGSTKPICNLFNSNDTLVEFNVIIPGMFETTIDTFSRVNIKEHTRLDSVGFPEIPIVSFLVAIPDCDSVKLNIVLMDSTQFSGYNIYPAPELVPDTIEGGAIALVEQFAYNRTAYETDEYFPGFYAETVDKGAIRTQDVVRVVIYPVQFNPVKKIINCYSEILVRLSFNNPSGSINNDVGIFNEVVGNTLINYQSNGLNASVNCGAGYENLGSWKWVTNLSAGYIEDTCDYLIITHEDFYNEVITKQEIESLAQHRVDFNGFNVVIIKTETIYNQISGEDRTEQIRNLIRSTYDNGYANNTFDGRLAYVNLFGDANFSIDPNDDCIPTNPYHNPDGGFDIYFTQLTQTNGNYDIYPDLMIGRCSVDTVTQVQNVVHKILNFKPDTLDYKDSLLFIVGGSSEYNSIKNAIIETETILHNNYYEKLMYHTDYANSPYFYLPDWETIQFYAGLDTLKQLWKAGKMFVSYWDHGVATGWGSLQGFSFSSIDSAEFNNVLPFVISCACSTGEFQSVQFEDCMAEEFLCKNSHRGAIGFIGASVLTIWQTMDIAPDYFTSLLYNSSLVFGEELMEIKLQNSIVPEFLNHYNLFGDPALNILYENSDTIFPDLYAKSSQIIFSPEYPNFSDTVTISACIRNNLCNEVTDTFYVACYALNFETGDTLWIGNQTINGLNGYIENVEFEWNTFGLSLYQYNYEIIISIDTSNSVQELNELNNVNSSTLKIYSYNPNFNISNTSEDNSHPVSFDLYPNIPGEEIVFGEKIISAEGDVISSNPGDTKGFTSIANLNNNTNYQTIQANFSSDTVLISRGNPSWSYSFQPGNASCKGPVIVDINDDGFEESMYIEGSVTRKLVCVNHDGTIRWDYQLSGNSCTPLNYYDLENKIVITKNTGKVYIYRENENSSSIEILDSVLISGPGALEFLDSPVASDLNNDGNLELILSHTNILGNRYIDIVDLEDLSYINKSFPGPIHSPIIADINNDGECEIITVIDFYGLLVLNYNLDTVVYIPDNNFYMAGSEIVSGDFNNDGNNDMVVQAWENINDYYINIYDITTGHVIFVSPIVSSYDRCWVADITGDGDIELIIQSGKNLSVIEVPEAGSTIGWPGQGGNVRNSGIYEHPAYFAPEGDTVYWTNTISLSAEVDNIIPEGSTVIIKPGTKIKAHENSSLIVQGTLIAEGTELFPITFTADINDAEKGYWQGITAAMGGHVSIEHCIIKDAEIGFLFEDDYEDNFENNFIENNYEGVAAFNASPVIRENIITGNNTGLGSYKGAIPVLTDLIMEQRFKNGIVNNDWCILINTANIYLDNGHNDIYNDPAEGYYINIITEDTPEEVIARNNYWGSEDIKEIEDHLYTPELITIDPVLSSPQSSYDPEISEESEMLKSATLAMYSEDFTTAGNTYQTIIDQFPESDEAYISVSGLFDCTGKANGNWDDLNDYYAGLYNDTTYTEAFKKLVYGYINLCHRKLGNYSEAIANYESIILNDPTYSDSIFAVIDIGNTYEEAGNYKSTLGQLSELVPESRKKHVEKTIDLLLSLKSSVDEVTNDLSNKSKVLGVYPNPMKDKTTIKIYNSQKSEIVIKVYDVTGREILNLNYGFKEKGEFTIELSLSGLLPGVYYGAVEIDNHPEDVINLIKL